MIEQPFSGTPGEFRIQSLNIELKEGFVICCLLNTRSKRGNAIQAFIVFEVVKEQLVGRYTEPYQYIYVEQGSVMGLEDVKDVLEDSFTLELVEKKYCYYPTREVYDKYMRRMNGI